MSSAWFWLALAIGCEIVATSALKESDGLRRLLPAMLALGGYGIAFASLARALRSIPLGVAYAIWSGVGIAVLTAIGALVYKQVLSPAQWAGLAAIIGGVVALFLAG